MAAKLQIAPAVRVQNAKRAGEAVRMYFRRQGWRFRFASKLILSRERIEKEWLFLHARLKV